VIPEPGCPSYQQWITAQAGNTAGPTCQCELHGTTIERIDRGSQRSLCVSVRALGTEGTSSWTAPSETFGTATVLKK
jgi:hypothetical protein